MLHAVALSAALLTGAAATDTDVATIDTNAAQVQLDVTPAQEGGDEIGPIETYLPWHWFPITDQSSLEPEVAENIWVLLILGVVLGPINAFLPTLIVGDEVQVHEDFMMEQLIGGIISWPFYYFFGAGAYLNAVGYVHRLDRNNKKARGKKWTMEPPAGASLAPQNDSVALAY